MVTVSVLDMYVTAPKNSLTSRIFLDIHYDIPEQVFSRARRIKLLIKNLVMKCEQILSFLRICSKDEILFFFQFIAVVLLLGNLNASRITK